ncbi:PAS domain-containing protein [Telluria mixta]|uniref:histidine kinase n=1 Tax=Telluria mixta TaxID=34071 RepID=A0ABT2C3R3_9BURK|nr:PAS domain-containing protein [Telluria mixta]MCS0632030.1 PAS domain-containing protein [Telluria mixta]WEM95293.1 PAS domain-containing protein [Telluria mixta]
MQLLQRHTLPSIRHKLVTLVLACALPILIGYFVFATDADQRERAHVAEDAEMIARALAAAVDRDLANGETAARTLANQANLAHGDLAAFHVAARRLLRPEFPAYAVAVSAPDGKVLLDTRHALGSVLPARGNEADIRTVFASGDAVTSGLHRGDTTQPWVISITVPVWREGKVAYAVTVELRPRRLQELLASQNLPPHWSAIVFDNNRRLVAYRGHVPHGIGDSMHPELAKAVARRPVGIVELTAHGPQTMYSAYARTLGHDWAVAIGFPRHAAREILGPDPGTTLAWIAVMLAISLGLAWRIGDSIARSVRALTEPAAALGRGEALVIPPLAIREAATVARALGKVEGELQQYRAGLESLVAERTNELQRSSAMLATVYATAPVGLAFLDRSLKVVMINDYLAAVNALPAAAHIGRTLPDLLGERGIHIERPYRQVLTTGRPLIDVEDSGESPAEPGTMRHWICSYYPVYGPDRDLVGINAVVLDITERKRQEQRNRDNEVMFRALFEGSGDAHVLIAYGAGFISANQAAVDLFGCAGADEFLAMAPASSSPEFQPNGRRSDELWHEAMRRTLDTGGNRFEWIYRRRDGTQFHADVLLNSVDIGGRGIVQGTIRDITARVETAAALRAASRRLEESERMIRTVTDHLPALVGYWDADMRCRFANKPYLDWLERDAADVIGHTLVELIDEDQIRDVMPHLEAVLRGERQFFERRLHRKGSGKVIQAWGSYIPDFDADGRVQGFYMLHADITELKRTQSRLEEALRAAQAASSAKGEFLANMSHEIRTPMNAIIGLARLLEEADLGRRERGYVARMQMAAKSLLSMLNDVLDYSKVEAGQLVLEQTPFALDDVLASIAAMSATSAWNKGIEPVFAVHPDVPARLVGDPMRLGQVLLNLVSNATKFTERGEVVLAIEPAGQDGDHLALAFTVRDTGIGIPPEQQQRMFEAFSQADTSTSRKYGGTGLGLAISRRLVRLMGGDLRVDSVPGRGATFRFTAPFGVATGGAPALAQAEADAPPLRVLVADDNASSRAALAALLAGRGWHVETAASGADTLALLRSAGPTAVPFDIAFIDSVLGDLDGASVIAFARADQAISLPRCALLAADPERERLDALAADLRIDAVLAKPFTPGALADVLAELHSGAPTPAPGRPTPLSGRLAGMRVLVVEDNLLNQEVANYVLVHAGASVDFAANGRIAVSMLTEHAAQYDAVLMDLQMPVMDGFEATHAIRAMGLDRLPIIAMTANALDEDRRRALAAGMDDYLAKPIDVDELVDMLIHVTGRPATVPSEGARTALAAGQAVPAYLPGIDLKATLPRFGGNFASFAALFKRFESSQGGAVADIRALLAAGDRTGAGQAAHRLRGVAANLGATDVASQALELEQALRSEDAAALALRLARLDATLSVVLEAARDLPAPQVPLAPAEAPEDSAILQRELAQLLDLLHNNNMKAIAQFETLRPALARLEPCQVAPLADAVATLRFGEAAQLVRTLLDTKEDA